ncbi:MAG: HupE/UreJ family protein [Rubrivivax sp.]
MNCPTATGFCRARLDGAGRLPFLLLAFIAALAPCGAQAHEGAPTSFASITIAEARVLYSLTTSTQPLRQAGSAGESLDPQADTPPDPASMATLIARHLRIEADGRRCLPGAADYVPPSPPRLSTTYNIEFRCDAPVGRLRVTDDSFDVIGPGAHTLLRVSVQGREEPLASAIVLADERRSAEVDVDVDVGLSPDRSATSEPAQGAPGTAMAETPRGAIGFFPLGIQHILEGWDHLLFLLVLVLPGGSLGNLVRIITAFTIAHSLTLAAAALEWISVPAAPVEALIALSIAWVAAENLLRARPMSRRWAVAFAFGLIHGLGFSNVLREIGLPRDALLASLLWFNLGIELGQLLVVLLLVPVLAWLGRPRLGKLVPRALSALVFVFSVVLLVQRI